MVLDNLKEGLRNSLNKIKDSMFVDKKLIKEITKDIQKSLIKSDVDVQLVLDVTQTIKDRALNEDKPKTITEKEHFISIVYEELADILGTGDEYNLEREIKESDETYKIMLVGLFGSGKTTTTGKLASYYQKRGINTCILSTDTWRPAAAEQIEQIGDDIGVDAYTDPDCDDPKEIFEKYEDEINSYDLAVIDTAGRDALNDELIEELKGIDTSVDADEKFLILSGDIGQSAKDQAEAFKESCGVTGVILTKMDGTAKGGGALVACSVTESPVRFIGIGEKLSDLERFDSENFVGRLLGMGDLEGLLEKTREAFDEEDMEDMKEKMLQGEFNLIDMRDQMEAMNNMGPLDKVLDMIPGLGADQIPKEMLEGQKEKMEEWKHLMNGMTKDELEDPTIMNRSRIERVSQGSGKDERELRDLIKHYKKSKKMMKMMNPGKEQDMEEMMKKMQRKGLR